MNRNDRDEAMDRVAPLDELGMGLAFEEARVAPTHRDVPVGCVILDSSGTFLGGGHNVRELHRDPMGHAELVALRAASRARRHWRLEGCTAYVTLEPCVMCAGAFVLARIDRVVFGCRDPKVGALISQFRIGSDARLNHRFEVAEGPLGGECAALLSGFFAELRAAKKQR